MAAANSGCGMALRWYQCVAAEAASNRLNKTIFCGGVPTSRCG